MAFAVALSGECFSRVWEDEAWNEEFGASLGLLFGLAPVSMMKGPAPSPVRDPITG